MAQKELLSPLEQKAGFALAVKTYGHYLSARNYIGAYVIAFSMLEDRVNAMCMTRHSIVAGQTLSLEKSFSKKLDYLLKQGDINQQERDTLIERAKERNGKLHAAMWKIDEFQEADAQAIMKCARMADKLRKAQKRATRQAGL